MDESLTNGTTLWELLVRPTIGLHFARFALFLLIALPIEIFCELRSRCFTCSFTTICLQLLTGVPATVASYFFYTTYYLPGERMTPPVWYYPAAFAVIGLAIVVFSIGIRGELGKSQRLTSFLRSVTFSLTVYFAITAVMAPLEANRELQRRGAENEPPEQRTNA